MKLKNVSVTAVVVLQMTFVLILVQKNVVATSANKFVFNHFVCWFVC